MPGSSRFVVIIVAFFVLAGMLIPAASPPALGATPATGGAAIEKIRYGSNAGTTRVVIELDRKTTYRAFLLPDPNRVVVDIPSATWRSARSGFTDNNLVRGHRSGDLEGGLTRLIFDLRQPVLIKNIFFLPRNGTASDRLVLDLSPASQNLFNAAVDDVRGDKNIKLEAERVQAAAAASAFRARENAALAKAGQPRASGVALPQRKPGQRGGGSSAVEMRTIIIDAGHGGHDPGAIAGGIHEKNITLSTAKRLKRKLEATGRYRVHMTRDTDRFIQLRERVNIARTKGGDLFVSLHADKIGRTNVRGASIYTLSENASDAETARLADQENRAGIVSGVDLSSESADVADILLDLAMREKMNESNLLARYLEDALRRKSVRLLPNSHRSAGFAVLKAPDIPSLLLEIGFLSNPQEAKLLNSNEFQDKISEAILEGIDAYFAKIRSLQKI